MAKTAWKERNKRKAETVKKYAAIRAELKAKRDYAGLAKLPRDASPTRLVNRCAMSGRRRGYLRKFGVSRLTFREAALNGLIPGVVKASLVKFMSDPISDMLTRLRNGGRALLPVVELPHSRIKENVAKILKTQGYVSNVAVEGDTLKKIKIRLKYNGKKSVIEGLKRVSKPGLRKYVGATEIPRVRGGLGVAVLSTSEGIMTDVQARKKNLGGELLCYIW